MENRDFCCYEFGEFQLDARRRALSKNGEKIPLSARNFDLLLFMVENGGRVLEHDELLDKVWAGTFVEQATLKKGISALRQILAEKPENEFIKTIPRRGYSFVSPVHIVPDTPIPETLILRETEREIIVEEYEEIDDENDGFDENVIEFPSHEVKALPAAAPKKKSYTRLAIISGVGLAAILLVLFGLKPYFSKTVESHFSVENVRVNRITNNGKVLAGTSISPDGTYLLYPETEKDGASLWLRQMSTSSTSRLTPAIRGSFWSFAIAPDNSYIYYIFNNQTEPEKSGLYKIPLLGGEPRRLQENVSGLAVSPDGKRIALVRLTDRVNIFTINPDGEDVQTVTVLPEGLGLLGINWTPDGKSLLSTIRKVVNDKPQFYASEISVADGKETIIIPPQERIIFGAAWLPDKSAMLMSMREPNADIRQIWQYLPASQEWRRVTNDNNSYKYISLTRDGTNIVTVQESRLAAIWIADNVSLEKKPSENKSLSNNSENTFRQITDGVSSFDAVGWLSDGRLVYSTTEESKEMIFAMNSDGSNSRQLTLGEDGSWLSPTVTGNGKSISFLSNRTGIKQVWRIDEDGKNLTRITQTPLSNYTARVMRDNSTVFYTGQPAGKGVILYRQTADGQPMIQLTQTDTGSFAVSPDEKLLAVEVMDGGTNKYHIELRSLPDNTTIKTFNFAPRRKLIFTPDNKYMLYDTRNGDFDQIMIQPIEGGDPYPATNFQTDSVIDFDWLQDSKRLAVIRGKQLNDAVLIKTAAR